MEKPSDDKSIDDFRLNIKQKDEVDSSKYEILKDEDKSFSIKLCCMTDAVLFIVNKKLSELLNSLDRGFLKSPAFTIIKQLMNNGVEANLKRAYFFYQGININEKKDEEYIKLLKRYNNDIKDTRDEYLQRCYEEDRHIILNVFLDNKYNDLHIEVKNNSIIHSEEKNHIVSAISSLKKIQSLSEVIKLVNNKKKVKGFGILIVLYVMSIERINLHNLSIKKDEKYTTFDIKIPVLKLRKNRKKEKKVNRIIRGVRSLPTFQEKVIKLENMITKENASVTKIADEVKKDVSITSSVLKLANSAAFPTVSTISEIDRAITIIGLKELRNVLYSIEVERIMKEKYPDFKEVWEESKECAYYCSFLAQRKKTSKEITNYMYISGLLHDIGKIVMLTYEEESVEVIRNISKIRGEPFCIELEEAVVGINHHEVGLIIAKKWNFPEIIYKAIYSYRSPYQQFAEDDFKRIVLGLYLSTKIIEFNKDKENFNDIYKEALDYFDLNDHEEFKKFATVSRKRYLMDE
jgi:HD-like signal output (HDOD) protein